MKTTTILATALLGAALIGGCGGDTVVNQSATTITKGQELTDLQTALTEGAITQTEYDTLRTTIMRRPN